jgi:hypothetical protein
MKPCRQPLIHSPVLPWDHHNQQLVSAGRPCDEELAAWGRDGIVASIPSAWNVAAMVELGAAVGSIQPGQLVLPEIP